MGHHNAGSDSAGELSGHLDAELWIRACDEFVDTEHTTVSSRAWAEVGPAAWSREPEDRRETLGSGGVVVESRLEVLPPDRVGPGWPAVRK